MKHIKIDNIKCWYREYEYKNYYYADAEHDLMYRRSDENICPICDEKIKDFESIYLIINNNKLFPNTMVHVECTKDNIEHWMLFLRDRYERAETLLKEARKFWPNYMMKRFY